MREYAQMLRARKEQPQGDSCSTDPICQWQLACFKRRASDETETGSVLTQKSDGGGFGLRIRRGSLSSPVYTMRARRQQGRQGHYCQAEAARVSRQHGEPAMRHRPCGQGGPGKRRSTDPRQVLYSPARSDKFQGNDPRGGDEGHHPPEFGVPALYQEGRLAFLSSDSSER